jgi:lysophospholipase L1-like esterase
MLRDMSERAHSSAPAYAPLVAIEERTEFTAFESFVDQLWVGWQVRRGRRRLDLLFLGDSLTELWLYPGGGRAVFQQAFSRWNPAAFGGGSDRIAHLCWRIEHGLLNGLRPRVVVLCIGANQLARRFSVASTTREIQTLVLDVQRRLPEAHVVLSGVLPQNAGWDWDVSPKVQELNDELRAWTLSGCTFVDPTAVFSDRGAIRSEYFTDGVHLSTRGYRAWAALLSPILESRMPAVPECPVSKKRVAGPSALTLLLRNWRNRWRPA